MAVTTSELAPNQLTRPTVAAEWPSFFKLSDETLAGSVYGRPSRTVSDLTTHFYSEYEEALQEGYGVIVEQGSLIVPDAQCSGQVLVCRSLTFDARQRDDGVFNWQFTSPQGAGRSLVSLTIDTVLHGAYGAAYSFDHQGRRRSQSDLDGIRLEVTANLIRRLLNDPSAQSYRANRKQQAINAQMSLLTVNDEMPPYRRKEIQERAKHAGFIALAPYQA